MNNSQRHINYDLQKICRRSEEAQACGDENEMKCQKRTTNSEQNRESKMLTYARRKAAS